MELTHIEHIGIAVKSIQEARKYYEDVLGLKSVLMGFGLDSDAIHSPNENYGLFNFYKGIETIPYFFDEFTQLEK